MNARLFTRLTRSPVTAGYVLQGHRQETPPARISAPEVDDSDGALKLLSDTREAYFDQSDRTRNGVVATFHNPRK